MADNGYTCGNTNAGQASAPAPEDQSQAASGASSSGYTYGNTEIPQGGLKAIPAGPLSGSDAATNQTGANRVAGGLLGAATGYMKGIGSTISGIARSAVNSVPTNTKQMLPSEYSGINPEDSPTGSEMRDAQGQLQTDL